MNLLCNGFPKSGNHALVKACELLGQPATVNHIVYQPLPNEARHVFIRRDPRNVLVSQLRHMRDQVTPGKFLSRFRSLSGSLSLSDEMAHFEGWLHDAQTHVVRYEYLTSDERAMRGIAEFLGVPYIDGAFAELPGHTATWNEVRSDYREVWTPEVQEIWAAEGGNELLARWGY